MVLGGISERDGWVLQKLHPNPKCFSILKTLGVRRTFHTILKRMQPTIEILRGSDMSVSKGSISNQRSRTSDKFIYFKLLKIARISRDSCAWSMNVVSFLANRSFTVSGTTKASFCNPGPSNKKFSRSGSIIKRSNRLFYFPSPLVFLSLFPQLLKRRLLPMISFFFYFFFELCIDFLSEFTNTYVNLLLFFSDSFLPQFLLRFVFSCIVPILEGFTLPFI